MPASDAAPDPPGGCSSIRPMRTFLDAYKRSSAAREARLKRRPTAEKGMMGETGANNPPPRRIGAPTAPRAPSPSRPCRASPVGGRLQVGGDDEDARNPSFRSPRLYSSSFSSSSSREDRSGYLKGREEARIREIIGTALIGGAECCQ